MILLDTNILGRILDPSDSQHPIAIDAIAALHGRGESLAICSQNIVELYAIATRSKGLGLTPIAALSEIAAFKSRFRLLPDEPIHAKWEELVAKYQVKNRQVFDLRIVAAAVVAGVPNVITFNDADFKPFVEVQVITPDEVLRTALP